MAKIDVMIPVYNSSMFIDQCLESLLSQSFTDWRAVIVDDCSNDGSLDIIKRWAEQDSRLEVYSLDQNRGVSYVRDHMMDYATSDYIAFLDSDDFLEPQHLQSLYDTVRNTGADIAFGGYKSVYPDGKYRKSKEVFSKGKRLSRAQLVRQIVQNKISSHLTQFLFKRELFSGLSFPRSRRYYEDISIFPKVCERTNYAIHTGKAHYCYRRNPNGIVNSISPHNYHDYIMSKKDCLEYVENSKVLDPFVKKAMRVWITKDVLKQYSRYKRTANPHDRDEYDVHIIKFLHRLGLDVDSRATFMWNLMMSIKKRYYELMFALRGL